MAIYCTLFSFFLVLVTAEVSFATQNQQFRQLSDDDDSVATYVLDWVATTNNGFQFGPNTSPQSGIITSTNPASYTLPAGTYSFTATATFDANGDDGNGKGVMTGAAYLVNQATGAQFVTVATGMAPWSTNNGPFTGSFMLTTPTVISAAFNNNYYAYSTDLLMTLTWSPLPTSSNILGWVIIFALAAGGAYIYHTREKAEVIYEEVAAIEHHSYASIEVTTHKHHTENVETLRELNSYQAPPSLEREVVTEILREEVHHHHKS